MSLSRATNTLCKELLGNLAYIILSFIFPAQGLQMLISYIVSAYYSYVLHGLC